MSFTYVIIVAECGMRIHKYIDDITITEQVTNGEVSHLQKSLDSITGWSSTNSMKINGGKTKKTKPQLDPITHEGIPLESVDNFKLLGIWVSNNITWKYHVEHIYSIASPRLLLLETTETLWCGSRRATYVLQVCDCANYRICLSCMAYKSNET